MRFLVIAVVVVSTPLRAQDTVVKNAGAPRHAGMATLVSSVTVGGADAFADEYLFTSIRGVLSAKDGTLWIIDGRFPMGPYAVRQYDATGKFVRNIGHRGDGPGEWQSPGILRQLTDGRVILKDDLVGRPLTLYKPNGDFDTTWAFQTSTIASIETDTANRVWVRMSAGVAFRSPGPVVTVRMNAHGAIIDTVPEIPYVQLPFVSLKVDRQTARGTSSMGVPIPFTQDRATGGWSPAGYDARAVTSRYAINLISPPGFRGRIVSIRRTTTPVRITDAERADQRAFMSAYADALQGTISGHVPDVPREKVPLKSVAFDSEGKLWVNVSQPSVRCDPPRPDVRPGQPVMPVLKWCEPAVYDIFDANATYIGAVEIPKNVNIRPSAYTPIQSRGEEVWGVATDADGVQSIQRYRMVWK